MSGAVTANLFLTAHAERDLLAIPDEQRQRVKHDIVALAEGRIPLTQFKKLQGFTPAIWQLTSGRYRVMYRRIPEGLLILRAVAKPQQKLVLKALR